MKELSEVRVIVITGVESSGKTTLVKDLAAYFGAPYVLETARNYLEKQGGEYCYEDIEEIAKEHLEHIRNEELKAKQYLFVDTAFFVLKIWSEKRYANCSKWILDQAALFKPYAYLLCTPDIPWEDDQLREHPSKKDRTWLYKNYLTHLQDQPIPFQAISGTKKERLEKAARFIQNL